jgi:hypothetical protein
VVGGDCEGSVGIQAARDLGVLGLARGRKLASL